MDVHSVSPRKLDCSSQFSFPGSDRMDNLFNPHCHVLVTDGGLYGRGMFRVAPSLEMKMLEAIFRHKVFKMLLAEGRIYPRPDRHALRVWHSGSQVFCGQRILPQDETAMESLDRYIYRASFAPTSQKGRSKWGSTKDSIKLSESKVQMVVGKESVLKNRNFAFG